MGTLYVLGFEMNTFHSKFKRLQIVKRAEANSMCVQNVHTKKILKENTHPFANKNKSLIWL